MTAEVGYIHAKAVVDINEALKRLDTFEGRLRAIEGKTFAPNMQPVVQGLQNLGKAAEGAYRFYDKFAGGVQRFGDQLVHQGQILATWSYRMMLATAPLAALGAASYKMATDLETSMTMVATQLDLTDRELDRFINRTTEGIVDLSTRIPLATKDMGDALYYLVSSMTIDPEIAAQFIEPIGRAAVAGKSTAEQTAKAITPILNVYQDLRRDTEDVEHVLDVLFETVKRGRGEFQDIAVQVGDFIQIAEQAGATFEEAMAAFAMATRVTTPSQAATWIANLYRSLFTPKSVEALSELGIKVEEIVQGTGRWVTKNRELTESERERVEALQETIRAARERIGFAGAKQGIGEEIWTRIQTYVETGELLPGVTITLANAYRKMGSAQAELNELLATGAETYQSWTGELQRRDTLDIITDLAKKISTLRSEQEKLNVIYEVFPRMRGMQGAVLFIENLAEITAWSKQFEESAGITNEAFGMMVETIQSKAQILKNTILALGFDVFETYQEDIKRVFDAMTSLFQSIRELPADTKGKLYAMAGLLVAAGPVALGASALMMGVGSLIQLFGILIGPGSLLAITAASVLLGDKIPLLLEGITAYGVNLKGFVTAIADLAVSLGIIKESQAIEVLETLGISVDKLHSEKIDRLAEGIGDIQGSISRGIDDIKEWVAAFGLFLEDVQNREGVVGTLVGYIERLIKNLRGIVLPEGEYEDWGPEEKKRIIDFVIGALAISKITAKVMNVAAAVVNIVSPGGLLRGLLGGGGPAAGAGRVAGETVAGAGATGLLRTIFGPILSLPTWVASALALIQTGATPTPEVRAEQYRQYMQDLQGDVEALKEAYIEGKISVEEFTQQQDELNTKIQEAEEAYRHYSGLVRYEDPLDPWKEGMGEVGIEFDNVIDKHEQLRLEWLQYQGDMEDSVERVKGWMSEPIDHSIDKLLEMERMFDEATRERSTRIRIKLEDRPTLDRLLDDLEAIEGYHDAIIRLKYQEMGKPPFGIPPHLGGYSMDLGGYPPLNAPNILASEFVLSPLTTQAFERVLGRLNQDKVRSLVTQPQFQTTVNFYKGSVTSRQDAEEAAEIILDKIAERAQGLAYMER